MKLIGWGGFVVVMLTATAMAETPNYVDIFQANNAAYEAYLDLNNQMTDAAGYRVVNVKLTAFSDTFRTWIKTNFPGGETASYAIDPYSIDCAGKTVGEHQLTFYDANDLPLTHYDFGGHMAPPIASTMKFYMMNKVCGF